MDMKKPGPGVLHKIFSASAIDPKDDWDDRHEKCRTMLSNIMADKSAKEAHDALSSAVSKDPITHEEICIGFTVAILTSGPPGTPEGNEIASRYYRDLSLVARDGLQCVYRHMADLALDRYPKLAMGAKQQLLWLTREMVQNQVQGMDQICWNLMRQIAGGDTSPTNLWLADSLLDIFSKHRSWLDKFPFLVASVVYTYLRLIEDHFQPQLEKLREKEVKFVVALLRDRFNDVIIIGRDLVRVLQNIARIPDIEAVWKDILHSPKALSPTFGGLVMLMQSRTSRRFLQSRITPEMEKKLVFLTSQVRFGVHKRYQDWFQRQYLSTPESQSLRCDLIRFIVGVIHPTNELLGSDIIPRWAVIGWLLTTCTNQVAASNAKLALFYDWLFFDPEKDNIMNIEPAILVMHHSMKPHPAITATLLDFLCRIVGNFYPREYERVRAGIYNSLRQILDKRVLPSLAPLFDNPRLDRELRMMLRERFAIFVGKEGEMEDGGSSDVMVVHADDLVVGIEDGGPRFSDDEEDEKPEHNRLDSDEDDDEKKLVIENSDVTNKSKTKKDRQQKGRNSNNRRTSGSATTDNADDDADVLDEDAEILLKNLRLQEDCESRCEVMEQLVKHITSEDFSYDQCSLAASHLSEILQEQFEGRIFPSDPTPESIEDSIGKPLFVAFRALVEMSDSDPHRCHILQLLAELYALQPRVGYYLLYFMNADRQVRRDPKAKANVYRDLCEKIDSKFSLDICLVNDMRQCQEDDVNLFVYLIPEVYTNFPKASIGNVDLLYLVVSCVDGRQICSLVCHILAKDFIIFKKDCYQDVLRSSLTWETFEQYALWQLLGAHDLPLDCVLPLVPNFSSEKHSEALTAVLLLLKQEKPTADILKHLMAREVSANDRFVSSAITYWMNEYEDKLGELISNHLFKQTSGGSYKRKRNQPPAATGKGGVTPLPHSAELVLGHLDMLRQTCKKYEFFNQKRIQSALQQVRHLCTESQKKKFMDLFALADSDSEDEAPMQKSSQKGRTSGTGSGSGGGGGHNKANAKSPAKSKLASNKKNNSSASSISSLATSSTSFQTAGKVVSDSSTESSGESEEDKPVSRGRGGHGGRGGGSRPGGGGSKSLKRAAGRISYKMESTDESSDEDDVLASKKTPKKRKKVSPSDSE